MGMLNLKPQLMQFAVDWVQFELREPWKPPRPCNKQDRLFDVCVTVHLLI